MVRSLTVSLCEVSRWLDMPEQPAIKLLWLCLSNIKGENNLRLFERSELERNKSFSVSSSNTWLTFIMLHCKFKIREIKKRPLINWIKSNKLYFSYCLDNFDSELIPTWLHVCLSVCLSAVITFFLLVWLSKVHFLISPLGEWSGIQASFRYW